MNEAEYEKLCRDMRHGTQKMANEIFLRRRAQILTNLQEHGVTIHDSPLAIKKGRPKK